MGAIDWGLIVAFLTLLLSVFIAGYKFVSMLTTLQNKVAQSEKDNIKLKGEVQKGFLELKENFKFEMSSLKEHFKLEIEQVRKDRLETVKDVSLLREQHVNDMKSITELIDKWEKRGNENHNELVNKIEDLIERVTTVCVKVEEKEKAKEKERKKSLVK